MARITPSTITIVKAAEMKKNFFLKNIFKVMKQLISTLLTCLAKDDIFFLNYNNNSNNNNNNF